MGRTLGDQPLHGERFSSLHYDADQPHLPTSFPYPLSLFHIPVAADATAVGILIVSVS